MVLLTVPPEITSSGSTNLVVLEKQPVVLGCETIGDPAPLVRWKKDNLNLNIFDDDSGYRLEGTGSLRISSAVLSDTGSYMCSASNPAGAVTREIRLTVQGLCMSGIMCVMWHTSLGCAADSAGSWLVQSDKSKPMSCPVFTLANDFCPTGLY